MHLFRNMSAHWQSYCTKQETHRDGQISSPSSWDKPTFYAVLFFYLMIELLLQKNRLFGMMMLLNLTHTLDKTMLG